MKNKSGCANCQMEIQFISHSTFTLNGLEMMSFSFTHGGNQSMKILYIIIREDRNLLVLLGTYTNYKKNKQRN